MALDWIKTVIPVLIVIALGIIVMMVVDKFTFIQSFYWALATGTTVGYGDIVPRSEATKWFGCLYVFLIVAATARIVGKISTCFLQVAVQRMSQRSSAKARRGLPAIVRQRWERRCHRTRIPVCHACAFAICRAG